MKTHLFAAVALSAMSTLPTTAAAVQCVNGVYKAGCVGPNGAVSATKPLPVQPIYGQPGYRPPLVVGQPGYKAPVVVVVKPAPTVVVVAPPAKKITCVNGVYRAGCVGPNGAVIIQK
jgi:hypothetical protein